ncbi:thioesterase family protein [Gemmatimonas aurantiaca]|uniref:acyl-CoA thioesterase n=1 Tax=Gemmatimonas aurantiaca TaxID=173480 RepID=UPI00301D9254
MDTPPVSSVAHAPRARFEKTMRVPFSACDPAGIMFFVQYHILFQNLTDEWITDGLGISYADLLGPRGVGLPTVRLETDFTAPSRMGDLITLGLEVELLGPRSLTLIMTVRGAGDAGDARDIGAVRVAARQVIVCTSLETHRSTPFPADLRAAIESFQTRVS